MTGSERRWDWRETIVAPATARGAGVRAIVRLSGEQAHRVVAGCLANPPDLPWTQRQVFGADWRLDAWNRRIPVEVYSWPDGGSYTGQAIAEIHLPACPPLEAALETQLIAAGARRALPGEFSLRAFLAGRIDLLQAEGVLGLVEARNVAQLQWAIDQHTGGLSRPLVSLRNELLDLLADLEAGLDFAEEDIRFVGDADLCERLGAAGSSLRQLYEKLGRRAIDEAVPRVVLAGAPNAGKSSLFNHLAGSTQALVSGDAGTTRDYLTVRIRIAGGTVELIDTAGFDLPAETIAEQAAQQRDELLENCDVVLHCVPVGEPWPDDLAASPRLLRVRTKCDLAPERRDPAADCHVTVTTDDGATELLAALARRLQDCDWSEGGVGGQASVRLRSGLELAMTDVDECLRLAAAAAGHEIVAVPLRAAIDALGELVGAVYTDDLLDRVFSRFCIGK